MLLSSCAIAQWNSPNAPFPVSGGYQAQPVQPYSGSSFNGGNGVGSGYNGGGSGGYNANAPSWAQSGALPPHDFNQLLPPNAPQSQQGQGSYVNQGNPAYTGPTTTYYTQTPYVTTPPPPPAAGNPLQQVFQPLQAG